MKKSLAVFLVLTIFLTPLISFGFDGALFFKNKEDIAPSFKKREIIPSFSNVISSTLQIPTATFKKHLWFLDIEMPI